MPTSARTLESVQLGAKARVERWRIKFLQQWTAPLIDSMAIAAWEGMPPERRAAIEAMEPEKVKMVDRAIAALKQRGV